MLSHTRKSTMLAALLCGATFATGACTEDTDGVVEGEGYPDAYVAPGEAPPADAPGVTMPDPPAGEEGQQDGYPPVGTDSVPAGELGSPDATPGQPVKDSDVNAANRATE